MFFGVDGNTTWFTGVVEDRMDPDRLGRVRVRVFGLHSEEKVPNERTGQGIPTDELPWAFVMRPTTSAAMDGIGDSPTGIVEGTWVVGFSLDGSAMNELVVMGTLGGKPAKPPQDKKGKLGFVDPRSAGEIASSPRKINQEESRDPGYPPQDIPMGRYPQEAFLNESDVNRLARAEKTDKTLLKKKKDEKKRAIPTASGSTWDEKDSPYGAKYPYNHVRETESGHVIELDDTPGAERIHEWHRKGCYREIGPEGDQQIKIVGDSYTIVLKDDKLYVEGSIDITSRGDIGVLSETGGVKVVSLLGNIDVQALVGNISVQALVGMINVQSGLGVNIQSTGPININSLTSITIASPDTNVV